MASTISAGTTSGTAIAIAGDTSGQLQLRTNGTTTAVTIDASQNVGIGTSSPSTKLHVEQSTTGDGFKVARGGNYIIMGGSGSGTQYIKGFEGVVAFGNEFAGATTFLTNNTERMRIDSSGNLLVGTTSANGTLSVRNSSVDTLATFLSTGIPSSTSAMVLGKSTNDGSTSQIYVQFLYNNFGIGNGQINGNGSGLAAFGGYSDIRLKENVINLPSQLDNIMALRPVEFDWKDGTGHQIGFIAQEVNEIYPDLVGVGSNEMLTLTDMNKNDARLIKAIQELNAKVDAQAITIAELQARLPAENT